MSSPFTRRGFFQTTTAAAALAGMNRLGNTVGLVPVSAAESPTQGKIVPLEADIEPLVRMIEDTPRERLVEQMAARVREGLAYQDILTALQLAGVRNVQPRPSVGFKFHSVLVVHSAHLASLGGADEHRWLPIFWALDYFKATQADDAREGDWTMAPVDEPAVPPAERASASFDEAMERWDEAQADAAVASLARHAGAQHIFEHFARCGGRDFRSIGHKAIFVANAWRTLQVSGWRFAEPVLRSLAYALLNHSGEGNPADNDYEADRPWRENQQLATRIRADWTQGRLDAEATGELLASLRRDSWNDVCRLAVDLLNRGVAPQSLWDAVFVGSGELLMRQPGIVALHASTTSNAMYYLYTTSADDRTRRLLLLQNLAFLPMFRQAMQGRGNVQEVRIDQLEAADTNDPPEAMVEAIFADIGRNPQSAAQRTLAYAKATPNALEFVRKARQLVSLKGRGSHDYKFSSAVLEDFQQVSPAWRAAHLASTVYMLLGSRGADNPLVGRTLEALA
ncbi:MAG: hypothetical protein KJ000_08500 [Pirellulaceae bacterium]|nr:hypothetical protein [Pirellulaceae bacterium]